MGKLTAKFSRRLRLPGRKSKALVTPARPLNLRRTDLAEVLRGQSGRGEATELGALHTMDWLYRYIPLWRREPSGSKNALSSYDFRCTDCKPPRGPAGR